jgi:hypothetical protein
MGESMVNHNEKVAKKGSQKMVQFLTQVEESILKIILNNIIKNSVFL